MSMLVTIKRAVDKAIIASAIFFTSLSSSAQRATSEDIYGESASGSSGFFGTIVMILLAAAIVRGFIKDKDFRLFVFAIIGLGGGLLLIYKFFGKDAGIAAGIVAIIFLWIRGNEINRKK
jgi:hypothetical protein